MTAPRRQLLETAPRHRLVAEQTERVERGEIDRLIIEMPPARGK